jgi:hypothetical protein
MNPPRKIDPQLQALLHGLANAENANATDSTDNAESANAAARTRQQAMQAEKTAALRDAYQRMHSTDPAQFRVGDIVRWQPRLKNARWPEYGEMAVVVECLSPPIVESNPSAGSPYFRELSSLVLGLQRDGAFHCWHYDGRRFERV